MKPENKIRKANKMLISLVIIVPVFVFAFRVILPKQPSSPMLYQSFWANKVANENLYDIVVVGDSRIYRGINPSVISKKLNASVFNFGFSSAGLDSILLNNAIKLLDPDGMKILMIGVTPGSFTDESLKNEHLQSLKKHTAKDLWIQKNWYPSLTFFDAYSLSDLKKISHNENYYQTFYSNGFAYSTKTPMDSLEAYQPYLEFLTKNKINQKAETNFLNLIYRYHLNDIEVYGFRVPVSAPIKEIEDAVFNFKHFSEDFQSANGLWISTPWYGFTSYDGSHLEGPSANKLSAIIADSLSSERNKNILK